MKIVFIFLVLIAAILFDLKTRKIPNYLNFGAVALGFIINSLPGSPGILFSLQGFILGILLLLLPWLTGIIGAGDVKLFGVIGAFFGASSVTGAVIWFVVIVAGLFIITSIKKMSLSNNLNITKSYLISSLLSKKISILSKTKNSFFIPYAPFISLAVLLQFTLPFKGGWF